MKLSEIAHTLREVQVSPVKSLGQNFLHDRNFARWMVDQAEVGGDDFVIEIGPGLGALTEFLLETGARVLAIEKDARLADFLRRKFPTPQLQLLCADALRFDARQLFIERSAKMVSSLPYYVASQLVIKYLSNPSRISLWLFMLQREMARRLSAPPSSRDYGALTVQLQLRHKFEYVRTVRPAVFFPQPDVDSAVIRVTPRPATETLECDEMMFQKIVRRGFAQRRKQLRKLLKEDVADWEAAVRAVGFEATSRAEDLSVEQWVSLTNFIAPLSILTELNEADEEFPVVDENDRPVGAAPRTKVHGDNLRHRAVHILILNTLGEVFLQRRSRRKDRHPLLWDSSAAGHVQAGEEYDDAARRELLEELGIDIPLQRVSKVPASESTGQEFIWVYQGRHEGELRLNRHEIEDGSFFPVVIISEWLRARPEEFAPAFAVCWGRFLDCRS